VSARLVFKADSSKSIGFESVRAGRQFLPGLQSHWYRKDRHVYVAQKLSSLSASFGKETPGGDGPVPLR
jgi:hypothetical protein